jgi:hypothetical protein
MSTSPGMMVLPDRSRTAAPAGIATLPLGPIAAMRLSVITMSPCAMTSSPFIVISRALRSAMVPFGLSLSTMISTSTRCGSYSRVGIFGGAGGFGAAGFSVVPGAGAAAGGFSAGGAAAARSASVSAFARFAMSTSACVAMSCRKKLRPIEKYAAWLSAVQPMKSPPTFVRRHVGIDDDAAADTVGAAPATGGTVIM